MADRALNARLRREFMDIKKNPRSEYFQVYDLVRGRLQEWEIYLIGPPETPFEGGIYKAVLTFPDEYPMKPPSLQFKCQMLHPNIYKDGKVCISILQNSRDAKDAAGVYWRPVLGVEQAILSVVSLLSDPNLADPANTGAANMFQSHRAEYNKRCKILAEKSLAYVPDDFEFPKMNHDNSEEGSTDSESQKEGIRPAEEIAEKQVEMVFESHEEEEDDDDDFRYDVEDLSSDEEEASEDKEEIEILNKLETEAENDQVAPRKKSRAKSLIKMVTGIKL